MGKPSTGGFSIGFGWTDVRTVIPAGSTGHLLILPAGDVLGALMDVWPVQVKAYDADPSIDPAKPMLQMRLQVIGKPELKTLIPWK